MTKLAKPRVILVTHSCRRRVETQSLAGIYRRNMVRASFASLPTSHPRDASSATQNRRGLSPKLSEVSTCREGFSKEECREGRRVLSAVSRPSWHPGHAKANSPEWNPAGWNGRMGKHGGDIAPRPILGWASIMVQFWGQTADTTRLRSLKDVTKRPPNGELLRLR